MKIEHTPEDMTVTVEAAMTLAALQNELRKRGQWLPIDPPSPEILTVGDLLSKNASGPRRFGYGTIRDYVIGMKVTLADGRLISSGGKVVKNVAGYDLGKSFIGSHGSLGTIVEATFKLRPLPEAEEFVETQCDSLDGANALIEKILDSELTPIALDLHNGERLTLVVGFDGTREDVDWQLAKARELGFTTKSSLDHQKQFFADAKPFQKVSVLPSKTTETIKALRNTPFVAHAGNRVSYHRSAVAFPKDELPVKLTQRLKNEFDPKNLLPALPL